jgi:hypothetical protein
MSGIFQGEACCRLKDIFGFFSFPCGLPRRRTLPVQGAPCLQKPFRIEARSGAEDRHSKSASDEERYYMREYTPGDRLRDINWKSSERIDTLITRISPDNQEKVHRIDVYLRNYGPGGGASRCGLGQLWLLDRAKARLARFLRSVKEAEAGYVFHIRAARGVWDIETRDELEAFIGELAGMPFFPSPQGDSGVPEPDAGGEVYVFSTACDTGLPAFLITRQAGPLTLFFIRPAAADTPAGEVESLYLRNFPARGIIPSPRWLLEALFKRKTVPIPPHSSGGRIETGYAELRW